MDALKHIAQKVAEVFNAPLFTLDSFRFTLWVFLYLTVLVFLLFWATSWLNRFVVYRVMDRSKVALGVRLAVGSIIRYIVVVVGLVVIFQTAGINLSSITIIFGALGVGIGFGLQNITNNFVSGLIILLERPIKVGDRIEVGGGVAGDVVNISMRATTIVTNDNISIIVPNSEFISKTVINWSHTNRQVRFNFPVHVAYKEDPERVRRLLIDLAMKQPGVLNDPPPDVLFVAHGASALEFNLRVWTEEFVDRPGVLKSQLYYRIFAVFREQGIEIPFPQHDIHIKSDKRE